MVTWRRVLSCALAGLLGTQLISVQAAQAQPGAAQPGEAGAPPGQRSAKILTGSHVLPANTAPAAKSGPAAKRPAGAVPDRRAVPVPAKNERQPRRIKPTLRTTGTAKTGYRAATSTLVAEPDATTRLYANADGTMTALLSPGQVTTDGDTYVMSGAGDQSGSLDLQVGTQDGGAHIGRAYLSFGSLATTLKNKYVDGAALTLYNTWADSCTATPVTVFQVGEAWSPSSLRWPGATVNRAYETRSFAHQGGSATCGPAWESLALDAGDATGWTHGTTFRGLSVRAVNEKSNAQFKRFAAAESANPPLLNITYANEGAAYTVDSVLLPTNATAGQVTAKVTNQGSTTWPAAGAYKLGVVVKSGSTTVATSAKVSPPAAIAPMATGTITVPIPAVAPGDYTVELQMYDASGADFHSAYGVPVGTFPIKVSNVLPAANFEQPGNGDEVESITPTLYAEGVDPDNWPPSAKLRYDFKICSGTADAPVNCVSSGWTGHTWTPPALDWSRTYYWWVRVHDTSGAGPYAGPLALTTRVPQPEITSNLAGSPGSVQAPGVSPAIGNYSTVATDASVSTVGPDLTITRTYNSLDPRRANAFGAGWASRVDTKLTEDRVAGAATAPSVVITLPTGRQVRFGRNPDGGYAPPQGQALTLVRNDTDATWTLRDATANRWVFDALGRLVRLIDPAGLTETLRYDTADHVAEITNDVSGRKLALTWTGAHVTQVRANGGPAWTYTYDGDRLTAACGPDPAPNCTTYAYGGASHYRTAVLNDAPRGYWRLGETTGPAAASSTARSPGDDAGTYTGVVLNADGALGGTGDRAAVFDGVSSRVTLPAKVTSASMSAAVEMWIKTTGSGTLLSYQSGQPFPASSADWTPVLYVGVDGLLYGGFSVPAPDGTRQAVSDAPVNDGAWHHVVLSAAISKQTLYVDGTAQKIVASGPVDHGDQIQYTIGAGQGKDWPATNGEGFYFDGAIDEVALYTRPLSAPAVAAHYAAAGRADVLTGVVLPQDSRRFATVGYDDENDRVSTLTDSWGRAWRIDPPTRNGGFGTIAVHGPYPDWVYAFDYDHGTRLTSVSHDGAAHYYAYNTAGFVAQVTDANNHATSLTTDDRGNVLSTRTCRTASACNTAYATYYENTADPLDPRNDKVTTRSDARSAGPDDTTYRTSYDYDTAGRLLKVTSPKPAGVTANPTETWTYATGTEAADGGGTVPAGLLVKQTGKRGQPTSYAYLSNGDLNVTLSPTGLRTAYTYDNLGRVGTVSTGNDGGATFATTSYTYTASSAVQTETGPAVKNPITGVTHQKITSYTYDGDGNQLTITESDATPVGSGGDPPRVTGLAYDAHDRKSSSTGPDQRVTTTSYSADGLTITTTDPAGTKMIDVYDDGGRLLTTTAEGAGVDPQNPAATAMTLQWRGYDPAGRLVQSQDAQGRITRYTYYDDDLVASTVRTGYHDSAGGVRDVPLTRFEYDPAGHPTRTTAAGVTTAYTYDASGAVAQTVTDPAALQRTTAYQRDADGNPVLVTATGSAQPGRSEVTGYTYGPDNQVTRTEQRLDGGGTLTGATTYDERGLPRSVQNARLLTTDLTYDANGRLSTTTSPAVDTWAGGVQTRNVRPVTVAGYDTFGETTGVKDPTGAITTTAYDGNGLPRTVTQPTYAPPGSIAITPVTTYEYDAVGNNVRTTDPLQRVTASTFDPYGNVLTTTLPQVGDQPSTTAYRYDRVGEPVATTTPGGVQTLSTYDELGQVATRTAVEREPVTSYLISYVDYNDAGKPTRTVTPEQHVTTMAYDGAAELTAVTDPTGRVSTVGYDIAGRVATQTDASGLVTTTSYDLAGRAVGGDQRRDGTVLRSTSSVLDPDGNTTSLVSAAGRVTTSEYDALDRVVAQTSRPDAATTIRVETGYDAAGHVTHAVDGGRHATDYTYNVWGLPESTVEPGGATWTTAYDAAGQAVTNRLPGGVVRSQEYDAQGRATVEHGTGAETTSADRVLGYDADGRVVRTGGAAGDSTYRYDDRGDLVQSAGAAGTGSWSWSGDGTLTSRTDASGTATFTYDAAGRPASFADPVTGHTVDYAYDTAGRLGTVIDRAVSKTVKRVLTYDDLSRLASDRVEQTVNVGLPARVLIGDTYGYDADDNATAKTAYQPSGSVANTYTYDGAGRLSTWNDGTTTTSYAFDGAGNRVRAGPVTAVYNERNQLVDDGTSTYAYTPRGTLDTVTPKDGGSAKDYSYDAFERLVSDGDTTYGYDALDRVATVNGAGGRSYAGLTNDVVADGTRVVSRDSDGNPFADRAAAAATGKMLFADQHGDVTGRYLSSSAGDTRTYDPFGQVGGASGETPAVGYQGAWTDAASGSVNMASRWYDPSTGGFLSRDSVVNPPSTDGSANPYAYGSGDPIGNTDPSGHWTDGPHGTSTLTRSTSGSTLTRFGPGTGVRPAGPIYSKPATPPKILPRWARAIGRASPVINAGIAFWDIVFDSPSDALAGSCMGPNGKTLEAGMALCNPDTWCPRGYTQYCDKTSKKTSHFRVKIDDIMDWLRDQVAGAGGSGGKGPGSGSGTGTGSSGGGGGGGGWTAPPPPPPWLPPLLIPVTPPSPSKSTTPRVTQVRAVRNSTQWIDPGTEMTQDSIDVTDPGLVTGTVLTQQFEADGGEPWRSNWRLSIWDATNAVNNSEWETEEDDCVNGTGSGIRYWELNSLLDASGADACYDKTPTDGSRASKDPRGWSTGQGLARGHLIGRMLNGDGSKLENLTPLYQNQVNSSAMFHGVEQVVYKWIGTNNRVYYRVQPDYGSRTDGIPNYVNILVGAKQGILLIRIENHI